MLRVQCQEPVGALEVERPVRGRLHVVDVVEHRRLAPNGRPHPRAVAAQPVQHRRRQPRRVGRGLRARRRLRGVALGEGDVQADGRQVRELVRVEGCRGLCRWCGCRVCCCRVATRRRKRNRHRRRRVHRHVERKRKRVVGVDDHLGEDGLQRAELNGPRVVLAVLHWGDVSRATAPRAGRRTVPSESMRRHAAASRVTCPSFREPRPWSRPPSNACRD